jgi:hypothetical protein
VDRIGIDSGHVSGRAGRSTTRRTFVLPVEGTVPATPAERMGFRVPLTVCYKEAIRGSPSTIDKYTHPKDEVPMQVTHCNLISSIVPHARCHPKNQNEPFVYKQRGLLANTHNNVSSMHSRMGCIHQTPIPSSPLCQRYRTIGLPHSR